MYTTAFWLHFPAEFLARFADLSPVIKEDWLLGALLRTVELYASCAIRAIWVSITEDIGGSPPSEPNLYLYDNYPGGIGQSAALFKLAPRLLDGATLWRHAHANPAALAASAPSARSASGVKRSRQDSRELVQAAEPNKAPPAKPTLLHCENVIFPTPLRDFNGYTLGFPGGSAKNKHRVYQLANSFSKEL